MNKEEIKIIIKELLGRLSVSHDDILIFEAEEEGTARFLIKTKEPEVLIGHDGMNLLAINHVVKRIVEKGTGETGGVGFIIDVNDYQKNKIEGLRQKAKMMAERARFFKSSVSLEPMSSYERMIVHSYLATLPYLTTE